MALAIILVMFRRFGHIDLSAAPDLTDESADGAEPARWTLTLTWTPAPRRAGRRQR